MADNTAITPRQALQDLVSLRQRRTRLREEYDGDGVREIAAKLDRAWEVAEKALLDTAAEVPAGWQLVPITPEPRMIEAICRSHTNGAWPGDFGASAQRVRRDHAADGWDAALRVAPPAPKVI
jgi:hypothetical protein